MNPPKKIFAGVFILQGEVGGRPLYLTLLIGKESSLLLDTGCASDVKNLIVPSMRKLGFPPAKLKWIVNTHCDVDHQGGNHGMKKIAPQAVLACGNADRHAVASPAGIYRERYEAYRQEHEHFYPPSVEKWLKKELGQPQPIELTFRGGERIRLSPDWEVEIVSLSGHSQGHLGVLDRKHQALYGGDAVHGSVYLDLRGKAALGPTYLHIESYLHTLDYVERMGLKTYVGCHWPVKRGRQIQAFCRESRQFVKRAEKLILQAISASPGGITLSQLCGQVGPKLGDWPVSANPELCYAIAGHLDDLARRGLIRKIATRRPVVYKKRKGRS